MDGADENSSRMVLDGDDGSHAQEMRALPLIWINYTYCSLT